MTGPERHPASTMAIEIDREDDGRWIGDIPPLPGVTVYGRSIADAIARVRVLAADVILDRIAAGVSVPPGFESASESSILETIYLMTIPGMAESIREGMNTSLDDCSDEIDWLPADGQPNTH